MYNIVMIVVVVFVVAVGRAGGEGKMQFRLLILLGSLQRLNRVHLYL